MAMEFLNADLEITASGPLEAIRDAFASFGPRFFELHHGPVEPGIFMASFEAHPESTAPDGGPAGAGEKIEAFCHTISEFSGPARESWLRANRRVIDLGYQSADHCVPLKDLLEASTLAKLAGLGIDLAITIYPQTLSSTSATQGCEDTRQS